MQRLLVGLGEILPDGAAALGRLHLHEAPWLAQPDRRGMRGNLDQVVEQGLRHRIGAEATHVAPPQHEIAEGRPERRVERQMNGRHRLGGGFGLGHEGALLIA